MLGGGWGEPVHKRERLWAWWGIRFWQEHPGLYGHGMYPPTEGKITFKGEDISAGAEAAPRRKKDANSFPDPRLFFESTPIKQILELPLKVQ